MFSLGTLYIPDLPQTTEDFPPLGTQRRTVVEVLEVALEEVRVSSILVRRNGKPNQQCLNLWSSSGQIIFTRSDEDPGSWMLIPDGLHRSNQTVTEPGLRRAAESALPALQDLCAQLPEDHLPGQSIDCLKPQERQLTEIELAPLSDWPKEVYHQFGGCLAYIAQRLACAREFDRDTVETAALNKRLRKQFGLLPVGTIMVERRGYGRVVVVSDRKGRRTKRSLILRESGKTSGSRTLDIMQDIRASFALVTQERAKTLRPGMLSAHEVSTALSQMKALAASCPDLL